MSEGRITVRATSSPAGSASAATATATASASDTPARPESLVRVRRMLLACAFGWCLLLLFNVYLKVWEDGQFSARLGFSLEQWLVRNSGLAVVVALTAGGAMVTLRGRPTGRRLRQTWLAFSFFHTLAIGLAEAQFPVTLETAWRPPAALVWIVMFPSLLPGGGSGTLRVVLGCLATLPVMTIAGVLWRGQVLDPLTGLTLAGATIASSLVTMTPIALFLRMAEELSEARRKVRELGSYRLEERLGQGGMGEVWTAHHQLLKRPAAVKLIRPEVFRKSDEDIAIALTRFEREAMITASLQCQHTVHIYDFGRAPGGELYYAMELLDGIDVQRLVDRHGPLSPARAVHLLRQACLSLAEAHDRSFTHRDIKPANLFVAHYARQHDFLKVLDFGLVKGDEADADLTAHGLVTGTLGYLPPEVLSEEEHGPQGDIYALGAVGWFMLTGHAVFQHKNPGALLVAHLSQRPDPQELPAQCPASLRSILLRCLAKRPADRFASADSLHTALTAVAHEHAWNAPDARRWWERSHTARPEVTGAFAAYGAPTRVEALGPDSTMSLDELPEVPEDSLP